MFKTCSPTNSVIQLTSVPEEISNLLEKYSSHIAPIQRKILSLYLFCKEINGTFYPPISEFFKRLREKKLLPGEERDIEAIERNIDTTKVLSINATECNGGLDIFD